MVQRIRGDNLHAGCPEALAALTADMTEIAVRTYLLDRGAVRGGALLLCGNFRCMLSYVGAER